MRRISSSLTLALGLACLSTGTPRLAAQDASSTSGELTVTLGELLETLFLSWQNAYQQAQPSFKMNHLTTPNAVALKAFFNGQTPITPSSREMSEEENAAFIAKWGYPPIRLAVAMDAVVVLVNSNNPIKEIKMEQLDAIYSTTRLQGWPKEINTWGDLGLVGTNWVNRPIDRWGHPSNSGTRNFFRHVVEMGGTDRPDTKSGSDVAYMVETIMANQAAIGYGSISQICASMKAIPLVARGGKVAVEATQASVADASYPLGRFLYIYINKPAGKPFNPALKGFLSFILSREGQQVVPSTGFVALSPDMAALGRRRLEN